MISVIILTHNEETNIARCLDAVSWSDDILVVDSFSDDRTVEISKRYGARVIQRAFKDFSSQRNFASEQGDLKHEWVLHLDADEIVTPELREELSGAVFGDKDAYRVSSKLIFCGKFLRHAGLFPWYQVRFGRKQALRFKEVGRGQREILAPTRTRAAKKTFSRLPCRATIRFIYMYLFRGGILDGSPGLTYCRLLAWYEW